MTSPSKLLSYGLFGLPLAMVALPIYVFVPQFYAQRSGLTLATIGAALLAARLLAALLDPLLGVWIARYIGTGANAASRTYGKFIAISLPLLLLGFGALFHPPQLATSHVLLWFLASLMLVYAGFGLAMIVHQSWGAALTQAPAERVRLAATREACALLGVIAAAALTAMFGYDVLSLVFALALLSAAAMLLANAPRPEMAAPAPLVPLPLGHSMPTPCWMPAGPSVPSRLAAPPLPAAGLMLILAPFRGARFRALFAVLIVNGVAAAIPATLFLFFAQDRLHLGRYAGVFLILYFAAAAASMPLWVRLARRFGEARAWVGGMLLSALVFVWAYMLASGAMFAFGAICLLSGLTLGADLALPPALLAGVIARAGHSGQREAAYFGLWNWGVQINLALAAGIALPLLGWFAYVPGAAGAVGVNLAGTQALAAAYSLLPCALKLLAACMLWRAPLHDV